MTDGKKRKRIILILGIIILICAAAAFVFLLDLRAKINDMGRFQSYRIEYTESTSQTAEYLKQLCLEKRGLRMYPASGRSHLYIKFALGGQEAERYGFSTRELEEKGFLIVHHGNTLYLISETEEGLRRACCHLVYRLTDENGRLLLNLWERCFDKGANVRDQVTVGDVPIQSYSIVTAGDASKSHVQDLKYYIHQVCGVAPEAGEGGEFSICLGTDASLMPGEYEIRGEEGNIVIRGAEEASLSRGICQFANTYLGWMYAGEDRESLTADAGSIRIPADIGEEKEPWIAEREAIVTLWKVNFNRGVFWNDATSLKNDIMSFTEEQLYEYVRMLKYCGFTGVQVTDMCSAWAPEGGYQYVHERLRMLADAAHSLDMKFTLWVWGAQFDDFSWVDNSVVYLPGEYTYAYENPAVLETFDKYYSIYAELADCCDRVIAHYYDPGNLHTTEDVAYFAKMLAEKFYAVNPGIDFGVNTWVNDYAKQELVKSLGNNITLYENGYHSNPDDYKSFRSFCAQNGCRLGTWSWGTCEREIDQLAQMNFNPHLLKDVYQTAVQYDEIMKPAYWSEMDSYHLLNVFSLYCAGQLLIDPSLTPEQLTREVSLAAVGEKYAAEFADVLSLIEEARSGKTWDAYSWDNENYVLKSKYYPAEDIYERSGKAVELLEEMIACELEANTLPLPIELGELLQLMLPHVKQINAFAKFRMELSGAEELLAGGASKEEVSEKIKLIGEPIPEYNTVIGLWGQVEARAQQELLMEFCGEHELEMPVYPAYDRERKFRIYSELAKSQKGKQEPVLFYSPTYQWGLAYGEETTARLINELTEEGLLKREEDTGAVYLADWERYSNMFY